jgi:2-haloacid dehalogenase
MGDVEAVVFDLGGVLLDWDPRHLYRTLFDDEEAMERFLDEVCTSEWNHAIDLGRPFADAVAELTAAHPDHAELIGAWWDRWDEMVPGELPGTVAVLEELAASAVPVYGLTNFSAETFPRMGARFPWLGLLRGVVVSGQEGIGKPDAEVFELVCSRFGLRPERCLFVDDLPRNVEGARAAGMRGHHFVDASGLRAELVALGLLRRRG